ncbi:MAG TPA: 50S ribosomal protein L21 [Clostridiales bacterium]|nr:50S ribosomal protein L21 [Clostridiales bacterium]
MYAIFENGSKQYKVSVGDLVKVEKLDAAVGETVTFPAVFTADDKGIAAGKEVENVKVSCEVLSHGKEKKIIVFKYKAKKNVRKKQGHRQPFTEVKVTAIGAPAAKKAAKKEAAATAEAN